jgi:hypothetical protein
MCCQPPTIYFLLLFLCWVLVLLHCDQIECRRLFLFSYICWGLLCALRYDLFWRKFHELLRRMYTVLLLDEIFSRHQFSPFDLWCDLVLEFFCWFFCLEDLSIGTDSHYHCVGIYICF